MIRSVRRVEANNGLGGSPRPLGRLLAGALIASAAIVLPASSAAGLGQGVYIVSQDGRQPAASATGRYVAFISSAQLLPEDTDIQPDAYVRDVQTQALTLVSAPATMFVQEVDISDDGTRVAYLGPAAGTYSEVWVRDLTTGALLNGDRGPSNAVPDSNISQLSLSGDGRSTAFASQATNITSEPTNGIDVFVKNLDTGLVRIASKAADGTPANGTFSGEPSLSYDGDRVAFISNASNLSPLDPDSVQDLYRKDLSSGAIDVGKTALMTQKAATSVSLNADGSRTAFTTSSLPGNTLGPLLLHDFSTGQTSEINGVNAAPCGGGGRQSIDGPGTRVAFVCPTAPIGFLRDVTTGATLLRRDATNEIWVAVSADGNAFAWSTGTPTGGNGQVTLERLVGTDDTPPIISPVLDPATPDGNDGWYRQPVSLTWDVSDPDSPVTKTGCLDQPEIPEQQPTSYTCTASSDGGTAGPVTVTVKRDATAPSVTAEVTPASADGAGGWHITPPTVSFRCDDATSGVRTCPPAQQAPEGTAATVTGSAEDHAGNTNGVTAGPYQVDLTDPIVSCTSPAPRFLLNQPNAVVTAAVADATSGPADVSVTAAVDTATVGPHTVTLTGADNAGRTASATCEYSVEHGFIGYSSPVDNDPLVNVVKAGQKVPLRWRAVDHAGAPVTTLTTVTVTATGHACDLGSTEDLIEETAAGGSGLQNLGDGYYQLNWVTPTSYARSCKTLRLDLGDGTNRTAEFRFTR